MSGNRELGGIRYGPSLPGDPALVRELARYGFDGVSLANSFYSEYGADDRTRPGRAGSGCTRVRCRAGFGNRPRLRGDDARPRARIRNSIELSVSRHMIAPPRSDLERLARAVRETRADVNYMVASIHFYSGRQTARMHRSISRPLRGT